MGNIVVKEFRRWSGALTFYTVLPLPKTWPLDFTKVASWAPSIGLLLGLMVGSVDAGMAWTGCPWFVRNAIVLLCWLWLTGGLHLDGAIDAADGLAVPDPQRRLAVMQDSRTGAFGVMTAIALLLLKYTALLENENQRLYGFVLAATWGRWGQYFAILRYPYLKAEGKGAFHRQHLHLPWDLGRPLLILLGVVSWPWVGLFSNPIVWLGINGGAGLIVWIVGAWFYRQFHGMTGDLYGAIVEWSEALILVSLCFLR
jgi:adenosylcobinamide-GDP ribazoletransferase